MKNNPQEKTQKALDDAQKAQDDLMSSLDRMNQKMGDMIANTHKPLDIKPIETTAKKPGFFSNLLNKMSKKTNDFDSMTNKYMSEFEKRNKHKP